jgi:UDP-3-O-[3-hydroxymyristoyl] glucosamine N-acyltransferase
VRGDPDTWVDRVAPLHSATPGSLSFLSNRRYVRHLRATRASAVIVTEDDAIGCPVACLVVGNPYLAYAHAVTLLAPKQPLLSGIHPSAWVSSEASVHEAAWVGPQAVIEAGVRIGARTQIGPGCVVSEGALIGPDGRLVANVTVCAQSTIGSGVLLHPGVVIGADGFGIANDDGVWVKVPQVGRVTIGENVEIGANTTVDRGALEDTVIGDGVKIDNLVQIGHNVHIGTHTAIAGCAGIAGSSRIGSRCTVGGGAGIGGHIEITDDVHVTGGTLVHRSIKEPGIYSSGMVAQPNAQWRKNTARLRQLDDMARRLRAVEDRLATSDETHSLDLLPPTT